MMTIQGQHTRLSSVTLSILSLSFHNSVLLICSAMLGVPLSLITMMLPTPDLGPTSPPMRTTMTGKTLTYEAYGQTASKPIIMGRKVSRVIYNIVSLCCLLCVLVDMFLSIITDKVIPGCHQALVAYRWRTAKVAAQECLMKCPELREANKVLVLITRSLDHQHQGLGTCWKCKFSVPAPDLPSLALWDGTQQSVC